MTNTYVVATKREQRGKGMSAADALSPLAPTVIVKDTANPDLFLVETDMSIEALRTKLGPDFHVEPQIFYNLDGIFYNLAGNA